LEARASPLLFYLPGSMGAKQSSEQDVKAESESESLLGGKRQSVMDANGQVPEVSGDNQTVKGPTKTTLHHYGILLALFIILLVQFIMFYTNSGQNLNALRNLAYGATVCLSFSGTLVAESFGFDFFGSLSIALVTSFTGGTLRDVALGNFPVFWLTDFAYIAIAVPSSLVCYFGYRVFKDMTSLNIQNELLFWADAFSVAAISVMANEVAFEIALKKKTVAAAMGLPLGVFVGAAGGIARDVLCGASWETTKFYGERYSLVGLVSCSFYLFFQGCTVIPNASVMAGYFFGVVAFYLIWKFDARLPAVYGVWFGREPDVQPEEGQEGQSTCHMCTADDIKAIFTKKEEAPAAEEAGTKTDAPQGEAAA